MKEVSIGTSYHCKTIHECAVVVISIFSSCVRLSAECFNLFFLHLTAVAMMDADRDYNPSEDELENLRVEIRNDEESLIDLESTDITVETEVGSKATSPVWKYFGILKRSGQNVKSMQKKIYCKLCFAQKKLKGYERSVISSFSCVIEIF